VQLRVLDDEAAVARAGAALIAEQARAAAAERGRFALAVSGGRTPWRMLDRLAAESLPWSLVELFQVDERVVPATDPARNWTRIGELLLRTPMLGPAQQHPMPVEVQDLAVHEEGEQRVAIVRLAGIQLRFSIRGAFLERHHLHGRIRVCASVVEEVAEEQCRYRGDDGVEHHGDQEAEENRPVGADVSEDAPHRRPVQAGGLLGERC